MAIFDIGRDKTREPAPPTTTTVKADSSAELDALLKLIPAGKEYDNLRFTLQRIASTFPTELAEITASRLTAWVTEIESGDGRTSTEIRNDIFKYVVGEDLIMSTMGVDAETAQSLISGTTTFSSITNSDGTSAIPVDSDPGAPPQGATDEYPGILAGGRTIVVERDGLEDTYYQAYEYPPGSGKFLVYQFDGFEDVIATFGPDFFKKTSIETWSDAKFKGSAYGDASAAEVVGDSGDFLAVMSEIGFEAASALGINDPTLVGLILNDPEMQEIMAQAVAGNMTDEQVMAAKRNTNLWKNTLYPGIEKFYGRTTNPEQAWVTYSSSVESSLIELGYQRDDDGSFKSTIGELLNGNVEAQTFKDMVPTFIKASQQPEFFNALDQWSNTMLGVDLEFGEWFDLLDGNATPELQEVAQAATLTYQAQTRGTTITNDQISRIVAQTDMNEQQVQSLLGEFDSALTALGERGLGRYGLSRDEILALSAGISPESGRSLEQIRQKAGQAMREEGLLDDQKISFFVGYDSAKGTPIRPGLNPLAPEVA